MPYSLSSEALLAVTPFHWLEQVWKSERGNNPKICTDIKTSGRRYNTAGSEGSPHTVCKSSGMLRNKIGSRGLEIQPRKWGGLCPAKASGQQTDRGVKGRDKAQLELPPEKIFA